MRRAIRLAITVSILLLSFETIIAALEYWHLWEWLDEKMVAYPKFARLIHGPVFPLLCLCVCIAAVYGEKHLRLPLIKARLVNCKLAPRLRTFSIGAVFDEQDKKPGWDLHKGTWDWFLEVLVTNESETPTTIEEIRFELRKVRKFLGVKLPSWVPGKELFSCKHLTDFSEHCIHRSVLDLYDNPDSAIPSLMKEINEVPLTTGIGHRGWLHFEIPKITRRDMNNSEIDVWLVDALEQAHRVTYKRGADRNWDNSFIIIESKH